MTRYVIIPRALADELHEPLRRHYADDPSVNVIVERRRPDENTHAQASPGARRRTADPNPPASGRRRVVSRVRPGSLPPEAVPYAGQLRFLRTIDAEAPDVADRESLELVARFQEGDRDAFEALYRRHFAETYSYLRMSLGEAHQAEDVTQQVFMRALQSLPKYEFRPNVPFRAWLLRIARNELVRTVRRRGVSIEPRDPGELEEVGGWSTLDEMGGWSTDFLSERALMTLSEQLPAREQQVFVLRYGVGLSIAETGAVMSASHDAVKSLAKRALARARQEMEDLGWTPPDSRDQRMPMRRRLRPSPVLARRRAPVDLSGQGFGPRRSRLGAGSF